MNNDFWENNFGTDYGTVGTGKLNVQILGVQPADTEGQYLAKLTEIKVVSTPLDSEPKIMLMYDLQDVVGGVWLFRETFVCSPFVERWIDFGKYLVAEHDFDAKADISAIIWMQEIVTLDWSNGYLNIVGREKAPEDFSTDMLKAEQVEN